MSTDNMIMCKILLDIIFDPKMSTIVLPNTTKELLDNLSMDDMRC